MRRMVTCPFPTLVVLLMNNSMKTNIRQIRDGFTIALIVMLFNSLTFAAKAAGSPSLTPVNLRCQGMVNPEGTDATNPELSWVSISSDPTERGQIQTAYQIIVAGSESALSTNVGNLWDSGKVMSDRSIHVAYTGTPLQSHQACFWKVRIWDRDGAASPWSQPSSWTMGFLTSNGWQPNWIGSTDRTQVVRKEFTLSKPVKRAWVYASALGLYELRLNGQKVGDDLFAPGWTDYRARVQYQRYDVTGLVKTGANAIGAVLAPGWYAGKIAWFKANQYGSYPLFAAELHVEFTDGSTQVVSSDSNWKVGSGPLTASDIQDGDQYDARLENAGWDQPGYNDSKWQAVAVKKNDRRLVAQMDPSVGVIQEITPASVTQPSPGLYVYDLGQNITGVVRIKAQGTNGTTITLQHAERINSDGTLDRSNLKSAQATDTCIMKGKGLETFQPQFTFHGFRYFSVQGLAAAPALTDVTGVVVGSRVPDTGALQTSDGALNQLLSNIKWTARNSYLSIPMDSSQRSERLGWTGDANVMAATAAFIFDMARFYAKWQADILDSQALNDGGDDEGLMPNVSPKWRQAGGKGGGWGDVGVNLPYIVWQRYGDTNIIVDSYAGMKKWLTYLGNKSSHYLVSSKVSTAGDWQNVDDDTARNLIASFYYALDVAQMAEMAAAIGKNADAVHYRALFENIRSAFIDKWVAADGKVSNGTQTAYVFALYLELLPENLRSAAVQKLVASITARDTHLSTGYLGSQWLLRVLADNGRADVAYQLLQQTTYPSWLYMASMNQTTLWESWATLSPDGTFGNKRTSLGHSALGSVGDWMFQAIGGLVPDVASPAFKHFYIRPRPGGTLRQAEMTFQSPQGRIASRWTLNNNQFNLEVEVPVNATATIVLPTTNTTSITESGLPAVSSPGVVYAGTAGGSASYNVGSGRYSFAATLTNSQTVGGLHAVNELLCAQD